MLTPTQIREFWDTGFLTVSGAFTPAQVAEARHLIEPMFENFSGQGHDPTRDIDIGAIGGRPRGSQQPEIDKPSRRQPSLAQTQMYQLTQEVACSLLGRPAHYLFDHVIRKMPQSSTVTAWHQDQAYLGKGIELGSVNFWIPLQAVDEDNGTLFYAPGTHLQGLRPHQRSASHHPHVLSVAAPVNSAVPCILNEGDLTVHHPLTLHYAGPNHSRRSRTAWGIHFGPHGRLAYFAPRNMLGVIRRHLEPAD